MVQYDLGQVVGSQGAKGDTGNGISSITKISTSGLVDTYRISFTDGTSTTFTVTNGSDASVTIDDQLSSSSTNPVENRVINNSLDFKAPTYHSSANNTYGLGNTSNYGHVKIVNDLNQISYENGVALSGYQGAVLKNLIDSKSDTNHTHSEYVSGTKVISWSIIPSDSNIPSEKLVSDTFDAIEDLIGDAITYINQ